MPKQREILETTFSQYELVEIVGQGGTGRVWRAKDSSGADVAVKILNPDCANSQRRKRFQNEIIFCSKYEHANVVRVVDHGVYTGGKISTPFYVMPLYQGSLRDALAGSSDLQPRLRYFDQVLSGVDAAHLLGVTHRDLKPENILYDKNKQVVLVADFGIAHFTDEELYTAVETRNNDKVGNFLYAAPEQRARGQAVGKPADIYALGLMLNEIFTGHVPQGAGYRTVGDVASEYVWIDEIVSEMIQQDPARRPASIDVIKLQFISRRQDYVARQRLSEIKNTVVPAGEEDDPLIADPPRVIDRDYQRGYLTLILSRPINPQWQQAFIAPAGRTSVMFKGPEAFRLEGNRASVPAEEHEVQRIIDYFKEWIPTTTAIYKQRREQARDEAARRERQNLDREREELERQRRVKASTKI